MDYLLDTNALLWLSSKPERLGRKCQSILAKASKIYFSPISIAEIQIKSAKGKLQVDGDFASELVHAGLTELPFHTPHAESVARYPVLNKHDPLDRMLLAQADVEKCTLITSDRTLLELNFPWIIDAQE